MNFFLLTSSKSSKSQLQRPASRIALRDGWEFIIISYIISQKGFHVINNFFSIFLKINFCVTLISFFHFFLFFLYHQQSGITQISYNFLYTSLMSPTKFAQSIYFHDFSSSFIFELIDTFMRAVVWRSFCWMFNTLNTRAILLPAIYIENCYCHQTRQWQMWNLWQCNVGFIAECRDTLFQRPIDY